MSCLRSIVFRLLVFVVFLFGVTHITIDVVVTLESISAHENLKAAMPDIKAGIVVGTASVEDADPAVKSPFIGKWEAIDIDGSDLRLTIEGADQGSYEITWTESYISFCGGEAGRGQGTGWLDENDPNILMADIHLECFTTGTALDFRHTWRYYPASDTIAFVNPDTATITWHRPDQQLPWSWRQIIAHPDKEWVEGWGFAPGSVVSLQIYARDGAKYFADTAIANFTELDPNNAMVQFQINDDLKPGDHLWMTDGSITKDLVIKSLEITNINLVAHTVSGIAEPGSEIDIEYPTLLSFPILVGQNGNWTASVPNLTAGIAGLATQEDEDNDLNRVDFYLPDLNLRINYGYDLVGGSWEAGHSVLITVTDSDGVTIKATARMFTGPKDSWEGNSGFITSSEDWSPGPPDIQPFDWVYAKVENKTVTSVQVGDITGEVRFDLDTVTGMIEAPWITDRVQVECLDWGSGGKPFDNKDGLAILTNGFDSYDCSWEGEWDVQPWQDIGVGYYTPDGHWVANSFRDERWMAMWTFEPPVGFLQDGVYRYHYRWEYSVPNKDSKILDPMSLEVSNIYNGEEPPVYNEYVLIQPWASEPLLAWTGSGCDSILVVHPDQPMRFVWGWVNDYSMTYEEALSHFSSFKVEVFWEGDASGSARLVMGDLVQYMDADARWEYRCTLTEHP